MVRPGVQMVDVTLDYRPIWSLELMFTYPYTVTGAYIRRGDLTEGLLRYDFWGLYLEGLIFGILRYLANL